MPGYNVIPDAKRDDSFPILPEYYAIDDVEHVGVNDGDVPPPNSRGGPIPIKLARHHIISWSILRLTWNRSVENNMVEICRNMIRLLTEKPSTDAMPEVSELCWAKRNLIIGPLGNDRLFDPGENLDFESPLGMTGKRLAHVCAMVELGKLMEKFKDKNITPKEFSEKFAPMFKLCTKISGEEVCKFERIEWTLNIKPTVTWVRKENGYERQDEPKGQKWHRSLYTPAAVEKYYSPNVTEAVAKQRTAALREAAHTRFVKSLSKENLIGQLAGY